MGRWGVGRRVVAVSVAGIGLLVTAFQGRAGAQEEQPAIEFAQSGFAVPVGGTYRVRLVNNTAASFSVMARVDPAEGFTLRLSSNVISPAGSVVMAISNTDMPAGTQGTLVAAALAGRGPDGLSPSSPGGVARATFTVGSVPQAAEPLTDAWSVTSYRFKPWGDDTENEVLPLRDARSCTNLELPEGTVGGVSASPGAARVVVRCTTSGAVGAGAGAALAFPGLAHHTGDYTGSIDLTPGDGDAGLVELSVRRTDYVLVPLLVLMLGAGAALLAARRLGRVDGLAGAERQAWLLLARVDEAHRAFRAGAGDAEWASYSFKADADRRLRAALRQLRGSAPAPGAGDPAAPGSGDAVAIRERLRPIAAAAAAWPLLADRLGELAMALDEVQLKASSHRPPTNVSSEPACLAVGRRLLGGRRLSVDQAVARAEAIDAAAALAQRWIEWASTVAQLESRIELLALTIEDLPEGDGDHRRLAEARAKVAAARVGLWESEDLAGLEERQALVAIAEARAVVESLGERFGDGSSAATAPETGAASGEEVPAETEPELPIPEVAISPLGRALRSPATGAARLGEGRPARLQRRWRAGLGIAVTGAVVVWSGLSVLYFDQPFGTPRDYIGILVWGLAAEAVLLALAGAIERLLARPVAA